MQKSSYLIKHIKYLYINLALWLMLFTTFAATAITLTSSHPQQPFPAPMQQFIDDMVQHYQFDKTQLNNIFSQAELLPVVISHVEKPAEAEPWDVYQHFFLTPQRIVDGVKYWQEHQQTLAAAQRKYGVDPSVIVAIIGIESQYGTRSASYQELGALTTLAFYHQARSPFFQYELQQYLLLTREFHLSPLALRGSYAGALGIPQFMPSSYRRFAVSYQHQPQVNLLTNHDDAIMSIANYLYHSGWQARQPTAIPARINGKAPPGWLISSSAHPIYHLNTLAKYGISSTKNLPPQQSVALIAMHDTTHDEYWLVLPNFHAIMSYNPRTTYSMAVYQLSQIIQEQYAKRQTQAGRTTIAAR